MMFCPTSHAAALVAADSSLTTRQKVRVGFQMGWRNLLKRRMGYFVRGEREGVRVGGGWVSSGPWWPHVWPAQGRVRSCALSCLKVGTDMCRSHKVSCRNMTEGDGRMGRVMYCQRVYTSRCAMCPCTSQHSSRSSSSSSGGQNRVSRPAL